MHNHPQRTIHKLYIYHITCIVFITLFDYKIHNDVYVIDEELYSSNLDLTSVLFCSCIEILNVSKIALSKQCLFMHHPQINLRPNIQFLITPQRAYQSFISYILV